MAAAAAEQLSIEGLDFEPAGDPRHDDCPLCGAGVLVVAIDGVDMAIDAEEVLEVHPCPSCEQVAARGHRRSSCARCETTGVLGEPLPLRGVAVNYDSAVPRARLFTGTRSDGEAVYRFHACAV